MKNAVEPVLRNKLRNQIKTAMRTSAAGLKSQPRALLTFSLSLHATVHIIPCLEFSLHFLQTYTCPHEFSSVQIQYLWAA